MADDDRAAKPSAPGLTTADVTPYVADTIDALSPHTRFTRYELLWLTAWLDHAYTPPLDPDPDAGDQPATQLPPAICRDALAHVVTQRLTGATTYEADHGTITLRQSHESSPVSSEAALYDACYQYSDTETLIETLTTETEARLDATGRVTPDTLNDAFTHTYQTTSLDIPTSPPKIGALQDTLLAHYPPATSPIDLTTVTIDTPPTVLWPERITQTVPPLLKRAVTASLITNGVLDRTRHPTPSHL
jgi:hypothetical protein